MNDADGRLTGLAPAKINLALHVVGRRADGYHLIDSLVAFACHGDRLSVTPSDDLRLTVEGRYADAVPRDGDNLIVKAAHALSAAIGGIRPAAAITLVKNLPVAAGIGGGSADAALTLRLLARLWNADGPLEGIAAALGADVPMCLNGRPARARGIGEELTPVPSLPPMFLVLANPGRPLDTADVFRSADIKVGRDGLAPPAWNGARDFVSYLKGMRNDLQVAAISHVPEIAAILSSLDSDPACAVARMTGSGASCFGLFSSETAAEAAATRLRSDGMAPWAVATRLAST